MVLCEAWSRELVVRAEWSEKEWVEVFGGGVTVQTKLERRSETIQLIFTSTVIVLPSMLYFYTCCLFLLKQSSQVILI